MLARAVVYAMILAGLALTLRGLWLVLSAPRRRRAPVPAAAVLRWHERRCVERARQDVARRAAAALRQER